MKKNIVVLMLLLVSMMLNAQIGTHIDRTLLPWTDNTQTTLEWENVGCINNLAPINIDRFILVTDLDQSNLTEEFNNIITAKDSSESIMFYFPAGNYNFYGGEIQEIQIYHNGNIYFKGVGKNSVIYFHVNEGDHSLIHLWHAANVGFENLKIQVNDYNPNSSFSNYMIAIYSSNNCFIRGIESYKPEQNHIKIGNSENIEIRGCYIHEARTYDNNNHHNGQYIGGGYGVEIRNSKHCLIENNVFRTLRHAIVFDAKSMYNVVDYNVMAKRKAFYTYWFISGWWRNSCDEGDICFHGNSDSNSNADEVSSYNLIEGNCLTYIEIDNEFGNNGLNNLFFRNLFRDLGSPKLGLRIDENNPLQLLVDNHFFEIDPENEQHVENYKKTNKAYVHNTPFYYGVWDQTFLSDISYCHNQRPVWISSNEWPLQIFDNGSNPALDRYEDSSLERQITYNDNLYNFQFSIAGNIILHDGLTDYSKVVVNYHNDLIGNQSIDVDNQGHFQLTLDDLNEFGKNQYLWVRYYDYGIETFSYPIKITNLTLRDDLSSLLIDLYKIDFDNCIVSPMADQNHIGFKKIEQAVNELYYRKKSGTVFIEPGTYYINYLSYSFINPDKGLNLDPYQYSNGVGLSIHIKGSNREQCVILPDNVSQAFYISNNLSHEVTDISIENLTIKNFSRAIEINCKGTPMIKNCIIQDIICPTESEDQNGVGIYSQWANPKIENNIFNNCKSHYYIYIADPGSDDHDEFYYGQGGAIYCFIGYQDMPVIIKNNTIDNCSAADGSAIYCAGFQDVLIENNHIKNCKNITPQGGGNNGDIFYSFNTPGIKLENCSNSQIINNIFENNIDDGHNCDDNIVALLNDVTGNAEIRNNSFVNNPDCHCIYPYYNMNVSSINNLFYNNKKVYDGQNITSSYCDMYNNDWPSETGNTDISIAPLITDIYSPIWNSTGKSPLIDNGDPNFTDPDGTRSDIGAIRAVTHSRDIIQLPDYNTDNGILWTCFPVLDTQYTPNSEAGNLLHGIMYPTNHPLLQEVQFKPEGEGIYHIYYDNGWHNSDHQFISKEGLKIFMKPETDGYTLDISGFLADPDTTMMHLYSNQVNWIGYFLKDSQTLEDAFGSTVWPHIKSVKTQHWFWVRQDVSDSKDRYTLNYGDMAEVKCDQDITFHWHNDNPRPPKYKEEPIYFKPDEKADYTPVYVKTDIDSTKDNDVELGIFMNGVCIGAAVINDTLLDVPVYPVESDKGDDNEIEFVIYNGASKQKETIKDYFVFDKKTMRMIKKPLDLTTGEDYYYVSLKDEDSNTPALPDKYSISNYPNPFNPITTIKYSIPKDEFVTIEIYNLKGQKVKTVVKGKQKAGYYKVDWNGTNDMGKRVSSGVYLYRLKTQSKNIIRKMILLK